MSAPTSWTEGRSISTSESKTHYASVEAEQAVLGSMMLDAGCIRDICGKLRESDFSATIHRELYQAIVEMDAAGKPVDAITVADELRMRSPAEDDAARRKWLAQLLEITPTAANALEYAEIVQETARRRELRAAMLRAAQALDEGAPETDAIPPLEETLADAANRAGGDLIAPKEQVSEFLRYRETVDAGGNPCVRTGIAELDKLLGRGMVKKGLYFLGARPGVGKTALAVCIAEYVAANVGPVVFVSMEMSTEQIMARRVAALARVNSQTILTDRMTESEYGRVTPVLAALQKTPMYITGGHAYTPARVASIARSKKGAALVIVDHFSLLRIPGKQKSFEEYAQAAHTLKRLAQSMDAPVLCLAQLNREADDKASRLPRLSDLRATGAAEEDADGVIFLHRQDLNDKDYQRAAGAPLLVDILVAKNRHGATGRLDISFYPETNLFRDGRRK